MARILAIDWDQRETRFVLARSRGRTVEVLAAASYPMVDVTEGGQSGPDIAGSLRAGLAEHRAGQTTTLVGVERNRLELLHFSLPPAGDAELPEMVINQAMSESSTVSEDAIIDFVASGDPNESRQVTAAVLPRDELTQLQKVFAAAGLRPQRLLLRPYSAASLFLRAANPPEPACLLVNLLPQEVDLSVVVEGRVVFSRTTRLPGVTTTEMRTQRLLVEINRTLAVAPVSQFGPERIERVYVFGGPGEHASLVKHIREELVLPATIVDPFESVQIADELVPEDAGRFASLVGMIVEEASGVPHAIDFLHPRRPPKPLDRKRVAMGIAGAVAVVCLLFGYSLWSELAEIDAQNAEYSARLSDLRDTLKTANQQKKVLAAVKEWQSADIAWLDELRDLSLRLPSARDLVVLRMSLSAGRRGGGSVDVQGLVRDPSVVVRMEKEIRDKNHQIRSKRVQERTRQEDYTWLFETSIGVGRREKEQYVSHLPPEAQPQAETVAAKKTDAESPVKPKRTLAGAGPL